MKDELKKILHEPYIIKGGNVSSFVKLRDAVLTVGLWVLFLYLLRDFYVFLGDIYHWLHDGIGTAKAYPKLRIFHTLIDYSQWLAAMTAAFIAWALYNRLRFANKKRRQASEPVTLDDLGAMYNLAPHDLEQWQKSRLLTLHHDQKGHVVQVDVLR